MVFGWSDDIKCARALIYNMLGTACAALITNETELNAAVDAFKKTLELFESVSNEGVKLKFLNVLQQTYNLTGQVIASYQEENLQSAIRYLLKAEQIYNFVYECTEKVKFKLPNTSFNNTYTSHLLSSITEDARKQTALALDTKAFAFFINGGLDKSKLEASYVLTLNLLSHVCTRRGDQYWADYFESKAFLFEHQKAEQISSVEEWWCKHCLALSQTYL